MRDPVRYLIAASVLATGCTGVARADPPARPGISADAGMGGLAAARFGAGKRPNALVHEKSPYLQEHAFDPVDWHAWGKAAFEEAKKRDLPVFVSTGYSTCHWCHVMHRESFEDDEIAALMNEGFVCVKIDREEMPEVDESLISAVSVFQDGNAGWPTTVFLGHDGRPFYGGTYYPKNALKELLGNVRGFWKDPKERAKLAEDAEKVVQILKDSARKPAAPGVLAPALAEDAVAGFAKSYDPVNKGFGSHNKFPQSPDLSFLLRVGRKNERARRMALETLDAILAGGISDHLGGGIHRYATDVKWRVPHFEKTLYDQALLASALVDAWLQTKEPRYESGARATLDYVLRDLRLGSGGFASAEDADSSGEEGRFYSWTVGEVEAALPEKLAKLAFARLGVEPAGSGPLDGRSILYLAATRADAAKAAGISPQEEPALEREAVAALFSARSVRVRPPRDEKVLSGWNGLTIAALARAGAAFREPRYVEAARAAALLVEQKLRGPGGRLLRRLVGDEARFLGALEDHAFLARGYVELYEATLEIVWLERARALLDAAGELFWDEARGDFSTRAKDAEKLGPEVAGDFGEGALPAPSAVLAQELVRVSELLGNDAFRARAKKALESAASFMKDSPRAVPTYLAAADQLLADPIEVVLAGPRGPALDALLAEVRSRFLPNAVLALAGSQDSERENAVLGELAKGRTAIKGRPQAFVCSGSTCRLPVTEASELGKILDELGK
ncbi:thioredoxin domain-containing protein [bacterium]|nr:thioredoxin domain-containing protein [bacterium]